MPLYYWAGKDKTRKNCCDGALLVTNHSASGNFPGKFVVSCSNPGDVPDQTWYWRAGLEGQLKREIAEFQRDRSMSKGKSLAAVGSVPINCSRMLL